MSPNDRFLTGAALMNLPTTSPRQGRPPPGRERRMMKTYFRSAFQAGRLFGACSPTNLTRIPDHALRHRPPPTELEGDTRQQQKRKRPHSPCRHGGYGSPAHMRERGKDVDGFVRSNVNPYR